MLKIGVPDNKKITFVTTNINDYDFVVSTFKFLESVYIGKNSDNTDEFEVIESNLENEIFKGKVKSKKRNKVYEYTFPIGEFGQKFLFDKEDSGGKYYVMKYVSQS